MALNPNIIVKRGPRARTGRVHGAGGANQSPFSPRLKKQPDIASNLGGIIHTYQKFDPHNFPSPTAEPPDLVSPAFEHMLAYGSMRELTDEELARAIRLDPSQIAGLGPSLDMLRAMLLERKQKILETYETEQAQKAAGKEFHGSAASVHPPQTAGRTIQAGRGRGRQLRELERLWYYAADDRDRLPGN